MNSDHAPRKHQCERPRCARTDTTDTDLGWLCPEHISEALAIMADERRRIELEQMPTSGVIQ